MIISIGPTIMKVIFKLRHSLDNMFGNIFSDSIIGQILVGLILVALAILILVGTLSFLIRCIQFVVDFFRTPFTEKIGNIGDIEDIEEGSNNEK